MIERCVTDSLCENYHDEREESLVKCEEKKRRDEKEKKRNDRTKLISKITIAFDDLSTYNMTL